MPRTKISKNIKRNRDAANREEKIRQFDSEFDHFMAQIDLRVKEDIADLKEQIETIKCRIPQNLLKMTLGELRRLNIQTFNQILPQPLPAARILEQHNSGGLSGATSAKKSKDDEGYLTEDNSLNGANRSATTAFANISILSSAAQNRGRTPGPLSSAKARKPRRSKSAGGNYIGGIAVKQQQSVPIPVSANVRSSRNTMRTPVAPRVKALSADRSTRAPPSSPTALLRWPKPGEQVVSMFGSPVVAQFVPEDYANVNIPIKNGVLSLRPKKLASLNPEIIEKIDTVTLDQIKTLQSNLALIMRYADQNYS